MNKTVFLSDLIKEIDCEYVGKDIEIDGLGLCNRDTGYKEILSYAVNDQYVSTVKNNQAIACLVISENLQLAYCEENIGRQISYIISENPEKCFYNIHEAAIKSGKLYEKYDFESVIGNGCCIADSAVIEKGVIIGNQVTIGSNTVVRSGSIIDDNTTIGCNTTIGSEGFQLITVEDDYPLHVTHVGKCHICSDVYVGDNTCICNSLFEGETYVGKGVKIDNLVHVGHNLYIGEKAVVTAHVILCGSARVEEGAWIAPNASVLNGVTIGKGSKVGLGSVVTRDVAPKSIVYGSPAKVHERH